MAADEYWAEKFEVPDIDAAKQIILTTEGDVSTEERWATETPPTIDLLCDNFDITDRSVVVDFGVGIGRVAKALIAQTNCVVLGVDISASMRTLGHVYCATPNFLSCSLEAFGALVANGLRADFAYSIWALQHSRQPLNDVDLLFKALKDGGGLYVLNAVYRVAPRKTGWKFGALDLRPILQGRSRTFSYPPTPDAMIVEAIRDQCFSGIYWK